MKFINGKYKIIKKIDEGSMGVVYRAVNQNKEKDVILKIINIDSVETPSLEYFKQEYEILNLIRHPSIVRVYNFTEIWSVDKRIVPPKYFLFSMEEISERNLKEAIDNIKDEKILIKLLKQIIQTLKYIHYNKVLHNDIRNNNIFVTDDNNIKFLDFGISEKIHQNKKTGNVKKANDWKNLFELFKSNIMGLDFVKTERYIEDIFSNIDFNKGSNLDNIIFLFNKHFSNKIIPTWLKYDNEDNYLTPKNSGIYKKYKNIIDKISKKDIVEDVIFIIGDDFSESMLLYLFTLGYFKYMNYQEIKIKANSIHDTLFNIINSLIKIDVENKYIDKASDFIKSILQRDPSLVDGNNKFVTYNKLSQIFKNITFQNNIVFNIPKFDLLNYTQKELLNFLLNTSNLKNTSWLFYETKRDKEFEGFINKQKYNLSIFKYDYCNLDLTKKIISSFLLIEQKDYNNYTDLYKTIHNKTNGKFISIFRFLTYLIDNKFISFENLKYSYNIEKIKNCKYEFDFNEELENILKKLTNTDKNIIATLIYMDKNVKIEDLYNFFEKEKINKSIQNLKKQNILKIINHGDQKILEIRFITFRNFCKKRLSLDEKFKRKIIAHKIKINKNKNYLSNLYYIINKLNGLKDKKYYLLIKNISILLNKYARDVYRKEVKESIKILEDIIDELPKQYYYNKALLKLSVYYYFDLKISKAIHFFEKININYLSKVDDKLQYYMNYAKANIFSNNYDKAKNIIKNGNIYTKKNNKRKYRYYFFNIKGLLYTRLNKNKLSEKYYNIVYNYVKENGFSLELVNFAYNIFLNLYRLNKINILIKKGKKLLQNISNDSNNYYNKKAQIHIYDQLAKAFIKKKKYKKALKFREMGYDIAYEIQNIDEMIRTMENIIIPKYYLNYSQNEIIEDLEKVIDISLKYKREKQAINSYCNLILLHSEIGNLKKSLYYFNQLNYLFDFNKLDSIKYFLILTRGVYLFSELGDKEKSKELLKSFFYELNKLKKNRLKIHKIDYYDAKCTYYKFTGNYKKLILWRNKYINFYKKLSKEGILSYSNEIKLENYLEILEAYHFLKMDKKKNETWNLIKNEFESHIKNNQDDLNWSYYKALVEKNKHDKLKLFSKSFDFIIKQKDYIKIDNIILEYIKYTDKNNLKHKNLILTLCIGFLKFYKNIPFKYKKSWINKQNIIKVINILENSLNINKEKLLNLDINDILMKIIKNSKNLLLKNNLKIIDSTNQEIWQKNPDKYIKMIAKFLKKYFLADRIKIDINNFNNYEIYDKNRYKEDEGYKTDLIENSFIKGDYIIQKNYSFGDPISTLVIPIINPYNKNRYYVKEKRMKSISYRNYYFGYVYIDTKNPLSNILKESIDQAKIYIEFLSIFIMHKKIHNDLILDNITKLYNREYFLKRVKDKFAHLKKHDNKGVFMIADIDHFKQINDTYGHQKGDQVLNQIASKLKENVRKQDLVGRYGGEEFIIYLNKINLKEAKDKAEEIRKKIKENNLIPERQITISIGCSLFPKDGQWLNILINQADIAMYNAKKTGRDKVVFWNKNLKIKETKDDTLSGIITDDIMRSKHNIRNIFELIDLETDNLNNLIDEFINKLKYAIPHKYFYYNIKYNNKEKKEKSKNMNINKEKIKNLHYEEPEIIVNWEYFNKENKILYYDLIYKLKFKDIDGIFIFSSPTSNIEYKLKHKNLLKKFIKIFKGKLSLLLD